MTKAKSVRAPWTARLLAWSLEASCGSFSWRPARARRRAQVELSTTETAESAVSGKAGRLYAGFWDNESAAPSRASRVVGPVNVMRVLRPGFRVRVRA